MQLRLLVTVGLVLCTTQHAVASDAVPHTFQSGEVISADLFNELFSAVEPVLETTIIGTWTIQCWDSATDADIDNPGTGTLTVTSLSNIAYTSTPYDSCIFGDGAETFTDYAYTRFKIIGNTAIMALRTGGSGNSAAVYKVLEHSKNSLLLLLGGSGLVQLTRANQPPAIPTQLAASASDTTIHLSWTDASTDETGFIITRKDSLTGAFTTIATTSSNATTYDDTGTAGSTYWYRVQATSANGASLGSNEVKITLE